MVRSVKYFGVLLPLLLTGYAISLFAESYDSPIGVWISKSVLPSF